jgi:hypothetical protein
MNNDIRTLINTLDTIEEGEIGRKIGSTIGGVFGDKGAKLGGDLGDKAGDFLDKFNPFSKSTDKEVDKDKASDSGNSNSDLKSASGVAIGQPFTPAPTSTSFTGSKVDDNKVSAGTDVVGSGITGHGTKYDIENQYAANPAKFRIAQNWKDGQPLDADGISFTNSYSGIPIPQDILHIEARKGWDKPMVNFDGSPILAGRANENTKPKEPDHPYYHLIRVETGERRDPNRVNLISLLEKDKYGYQRHEIKSSKTNAIVWTVPGGFSPGGQEILNKQLYANIADKTIAVYQKGSSIIWVEKGGSDGSLSHSLAGMVGANISAKEVEDWEKQQKTPTKVKNIENGLSANSSVGQFRGYTVRASGGRYESDGIRADLLNQIPAMHDGKVVQNLYSFSFYGPYSDWKSGGSSAFMQIASSAKYADGFGPMKAKAVNEELSRIIDLACR